MARIKQVHDSIKFDSTAESIPKLITCEKLLEKLNNCVDLKLQNAYHLSKAYFINGDYSRVIKILDCKKTLLEQDKTSIVLHLWQIYADSLMMVREFRKAGRCFYTLCKVYNKIKADLDKDRFSGDDYIRAKAGYAECLMNMGQMKDAINKFENTKRAIENEIVYENPLLFVNVCNLLGNCYMADN